jgi:prolyl-tRNA editing enzyme YbaK/EbsC (Cys-tRNA(Pro) deacylase)
MTAFDYLDNASIPYRLIELKHIVHTASETADAVGCSIGSILKSMAVFDAANPDDIAIIVLLGNKRLDFSLLNKQISFAEAKLVAIGEVEKRTGFAAGTLPPFGYKKNIRVYYDKIILDKEKVYGGSGHPNFIIEFDPNLIDKIDLISI